MANIEKGEVGFEVNGQDYALRLDFNALCDLEGEIGKPYAEIFNDKKTMSEARVMRKIFFVGLTSAGYDVSERDAGCIMTSVGLVRAGQVIGESLVAAFGEQNKADTAAGNRRPTRKRGTGKK